MSKYKFLDGKVALITGCSRGIGKSILKSFASNGADIWACTRKQSDEFNTFLDHLRNESGVKINTLHFDLSSETEIKENLKQLYTGNQRVDILVNNAGISHGGFIQMTSLNQIKSVFEINFFSQILITQIVAKIMLRQKKGCIINIASVAGLDANMGNIAYGSSKAALIYATKTMAKEFAPFIRVNAIAPGLTETAMAEEMEKNAMDNMVRSSSLKRLADPAEIAEVALFLASDQSSFINGQIIRVDGGI
jgi:3-oxoacyl-[acyl-carrier protein] reductase